MIKKKKVCCVGTNIHIKILLSRHATIYIPSLIKPAFCIMKFYHFRELLKHKFVSFFLIFLFSDVVVSYTNNIYTYNNNNNNNEC